MKILIATDGSPSADEAQKSLLRAGMPQNVEAIALSVADVWLPPSGQTDTGLPKELNDVAEKAKARAEAALAQAKQLANAATSNVRKMFPSWNIHSEAIADSPGWGIISRAEQWNADLIVVGSHGSSGLDKLIQGSVSQKVVTHAHCPVRVSRPAPQPQRKETRLIVAMDGSPGAIRAVEHVSNREWPEDTQIRVVAVLDPRLSTAGLSYLPHAANWIQEGYHDEEAWIRSVVEREAGRLQNSGLNVSTSIVEGDPKFILLEFANNWTADTIFVGARGLTRVERFLMGSVSGAIASRAQCSVEVVRH